MLPIKMASLTLYSKVRIKPSHSDLIIAKARMPIVATYLRLLKMFTIIISTLIQVLQEWL